MDDDPLDWQTDEEKAFRRKYGDVMSKATYDTFDYALKLRTGEVIRFAFATRSGKKFLHLDVDGCEQPKPWPDGFNAERGIDVRLDDIVWIMDAPHGS